MLAITSSLQNPNILQPDLPECHQCWKEYSGQQNWGQQSSLPQQPKSNDTHPVEMLSCRPQSFSRNCGRTPPAVLVRRAALGRTDTPVGVCINWFLPSFAHSADSAECKQLDGRQQQCSGSAVLGGELPATSLRIAVERTTQLADTKLACRAFQQLYLATSPSWRTSLTSGNQELQRYRELEQLATTQSCCRFACAKADVCSTVYAAQPQSSSLTTSVPLQTFIAGFAPGSAVATLTVLAVVGAGLCAMRNSGRLQGHGTSQLVWQTWLDLLGVAGVGVLVQVLPFCSKRSTHSNNNGSSPTATEPPCRAGCAVDVWRQHRKCRAAGVWPHAAAACAGELHASFCIGGPILRQLDVLSSLLLMPSWQASSSSA